LFYYKYRINTIRFFFLPLFYEDLLC
jgi:hypothetical protein